MRVYSYTQGISFDMGTRLAERETVKSIDFNVMICPNGDW